MPEEYLLDWKGLSAKRCVITSYSIHYTKLYDECSPELIAEAIGKYLSQDNTALINKFNQLHELIRKNADVQAANAVIDVIEGRV